MKVLLATFVLVGLLQLSQSAIVKRQVGTTPAWFNNIYQLRRDSEGQVPIDAAFSPGINQAASQNAPAFIGGFQVPSFNSQTDNFASSDTFASDFDSSPFNNNGDYIDSSSFTNNGDDFDSDNGGDFVGTPFSNSDADLNNNFDTGDDFNRQPISNINTNDNDRPAFINTNSDSNLDTSVSRQDNSNARPDRIANTNVPRRPVFRPPVQASVSPNNDRRGPLIGREVLISKPPFIQRSRTFAHLIRSFPITKKPPTSRNDRGRRFTGSAIKDTADARRDSTGRTKVPCACKTGKPTIGAARIITRKFPQRRSGK